jgi:transposase
MKIFAALDVSDKSTHVCVVDGDGVVVWRGVCATDPAVLAATLDRHAPAVTVAVTVTRAITPKLFAHVRLWSDLQLRGYCTCCLIDIGMHGS